MPESYLRFMRAAPEYYQRKDYYQLLNVSEFATEREIENTIDRLMEEFDPLTHPFDDGCEEAIELLEHVSFILLNADKRLLYDSYLREMRVEAMSHKHRFVASGNLFWYFPKVKTKTKSIAFKSLREWGSIRKIKLRGRHVLLLFILLRIVIPSSKETSSPKIDPYYHFSYADQGSGNFFLNEANASGFNSTGKLQAASRVKADEKEMLQQEEEKGN